jgi:uncharacterized protein (DUF736 family)
MRISISQRHPHFKTDYASRRPDASEQDGARRRSRISVKLVDPSFAEPIHASLVKGDGDAGLVWSRRTAE